MDHLNTFSRLITYIINKVSMQSQDYFYKICSTTMKAKLKHNIKEILHNIISLYLTFFYLYFIILISATEFSRKVLCAVEDKMLRCTTLNASMSTVK